MKEHGHPRNGGTVVGFWAQDLARECEGQRETSWEAAEVTARPESILEIARLTGRTASDIIARFESGACCVVLSVDGGWATSGWVSNGSAWVSELSTWFTPLPDDVYVWDCLTRLPFRGRGFYPRLLRLICHRLAMGGHHRVWIASEWQNWRSAIGIARAGFSPVGAVVAIRTGAVTWRHLLPDPQASDDVVTALRCSLAAPGGKPGQGADDWNRVA